MKRRIKMKKKKKIIRISKRKKNKRIERRIRVEYSKFEVKQ